MPINKEFRKLKQNTISEIKEIEQKYFKKSNYIIENFMNDEKHPINIIPKKSNIDLKRNLSKKQEKLNKRTEIALVSFLSKININSYIIIIIFINKRKN